MHTPTRSQIFHKSVRINAPTSKVWEALTNPELMKQWMSETEIEILTDWRIGSPFVIRGNLHGINFENKGTVLQFDREQILRYTHSSSISRLSDVPESYSIVEFSLVSAERQTNLALTLSNFPTETIYKHLAFYWNVTLEILKKMLEEQGNSDQKTK